ncbi:MAG: imidazole glycerol phosphate synthase subunit HisH [Candidatus Sumerlaeia bacterium]|nr:imidazole glycerol phosphate synthase subunit HisH [Candidatus Sumerlaeia bacterium]
MVVVIDYGMGNVRSVEKALARCGAAVEVTGQPERIRAASHVVLPGVGAFGDAMWELKRRKLIEPVREAIADGKPFLGICLGLQVLFERSEESAGVAGLGVLAGEVKRFRTHLKVPHMGWNGLKFQKECPLFAGMGVEPFVYFVHSYYVSPREADCVAALTDYDGEFVSAVARGRCFGVQFHPEKSQAVGLKILENFLHLRAMPL